MNLQFKICIFEIGFSFQNQRNLNPNFWSNAEPGRVAAQEQTHPTGVGFLSLPINTTLEFSLFHTFSSIVLQTESSSPELLGLLPYVSKKISLVLKLTFGSLSVGKSLLSDHPFKTFETHNSSTSED